MKGLVTRLAAGTAVVAASFGTLAGTACPASAAGCTTAFTTYSTVKVGTTGSRAGAVECLLHQAGYATSRNRSFSASDSVKLEAFQTKHGLGATGRTDGSTWAALVAQGSTPSLKYADRSSDVRRLQLALRALGDKEVPGNTRYGNSTRAAIRQLQARVGLAVDGRTSVAEWAVLQAGGQRPPQSPATGTGGSNTQTRGEVALAFAKKQLGDPYEFGAAGPDEWDCSGLTMKAWAQAGVALPHSSTAQYAIGRDVGQADLRLGDLVFFYSGPSHVGIYAGNGEVIHAPKPGATVTSIKIAHMPWKGARRPG